MLARGSEARREEFPVEGDVGEEGESHAPCEDHVFCNENADAPGESFRESRGEKQREEFGEVGRKKEKEVRGKDDADGSPHIMAHDERAPSQCLTVLLPFLRDHGIEQRRADAVDDARKNEEESPEEDEALTEEAGEEERNNERPGSAEQGTEGSATLAGDEDASLAPDVEADGHKQEDESDGEEFALEEEGLDNVSDEERGEEEKEGHPPQEALFPVGKPCRGKRREKRRHGVILCAPRE